jgi:carboxyl-terminal processing protease
VVLAVATAALAAFGAGLALHPVPRHHAPGPPTALEQVRAQLASRYYRAVPPEVLRRTTVSSMLAALNDRWTTYLSPAAYRLARRAYAGGYGGIGVTVLPAPGGLVVRRTGTGPAKIAGVLPGDTILAVDGVPTAALAFDDAMGHIIGRPGSSVTLRVRRDDRTLRFRLVRQQFHLQQVHGRLVGHVGVIDLDGFARGSAAAAARAAHDLTRRGARALVLDLRGNPGGDLTQAVGVASTFLRRDASIVSLAGAHRPLRIIYAKGGGLLTTPLAVLVDGGSASASEVVAGALKDHGRATIVGEPTFGKSLVQEIVQLSTGGALKLTVARYLTPAGVDISRGGVRPDVRSRHALAAALRLLAPGRRS